MSLAAVFQIGSLGDSIVSLPLLRSLRDLVPDCSEYLLISRFDTGAKIAPADVFEMAWKPKQQVSYRGSAGFFAKRWSIASAVAQLRYYRPRYCLYMMPSERSQPQVDRDANFFRLSGVRELIGFRTLTDSERFAGRKPDVHSTESFLRFRRAWNDRAENKFEEYASVPALKPGTAAMGLVDTWLRKSRKSPHKRLVALCPFSNCSSRNIPTNTIVEVIRSLSSKADVEIALLGGGKDRIPAEQAISASGSGLNACGLFSLEHSAALLNQCSLVICTESGPMHLAGALGIPTVTVFSRVNKSLPQWFPLGSKHTILYRDVPCGGCSLTECSVDGHPCMTSVTANHILAEAYQKLGCSSFPLAVTAGVQRLDWLAAERVI
jgi:ADP-heptose:LPS heptosyltransferase